MENLNTTSALQTLQLGFEEREERLKPYLVDHLSAQAAIYCGTYRKYNNGDGGLARKCSIAMRSSYHCPCSMMTERSSPKIRIFRAFYENIDEMLQEIT